MRRRALATFLYVAVPAVVACGTRHPSAAEVLTLEVGPHMVDCTGEAPRRCLLVRRESEQSWTYFYDTIEGFAHEDGFRYRLEVDRQRVANPPQDGSSYRYRLLRVIVRERAEAGP